MEIERKYLVHPANFDRQHALAHANTVMRIEQGYFTVKENISVRVRLLRKGSGGATFDDPWGGVVTLKTKEHGIARQECEGTTSFSDAEKFIKLCPNRIMKDRFTFHMEGGTWVVDDFGPPHEELIIAEIELPSISAKVTKPKWIGEEVTADKYFYSEDLNTFDYVPKLEKFLGWKVPK
jgi:adenylate cyclase